MPRGVSMKKRARRTFTAEFKERAVRLCRTSGKSVAETARDRGIGDSLIRNWLRQAEADAGRGRAGELTSPEREELSQLRKQVRVLEMEREILKKAAAFFAKESK